MYIFHISRTNLDTALLLVVFLIISFYTSESSADYPNAQIKNNTEYTVSGTVRYVSELCRDDSYSVGPGQTWKGSRRGVCLIGKIEGRIMLANQKGYNLATGRFDMPLPFNPKYQPVSLRNTNKSTYGERTDVSDYLSNPATSYSKFQINAFGDRYRIFSDAEWAKASNTGQGKSPGFRFINKTAWPVAVSFDQVGCLYYGIVPAKFNGKPGEFRRDTGAVWFTIQAHIQPDGINPQTDWDCIKPVAELVGEVALAGMTGGGSVAASGARIAAKAAVKAAVKKGLKSVAKFGANELGEYLTDSSSIKMVGQYAGYAWPVQCDQMPEYHITGGPVPSHDEKGEFYLEDGGPLKITKVNTCGNDMMMASSKSETAEPVNISNYFNDSTPTTSKPPRASKPPRTSQPPTQRLLNTDIHNFNGMPFGSIDAAYDDGNGGVVMFSSRAYARYNLAQKQFIGGTASLSNFTGMPFTRVDAAFNDSNGGIVMFSGGRYARYNLAQQKFIGGTASLSNFTGMPFTRVDASFPDRKTYKNTKIIMINKSVYQLYDMRHAQFENARTKLLDKNRLERQARLAAQAKDEKSRLNSAEAAKRKALAQQKNRDKRSADAVLARNQAAKLRKEAFIRIAEQKRAGMVAARNADIRRLNLKNKRRRDAVEAKRRKALPPKYMLPTVSSPCGKYLQGKVAQDYKGNKHWTVRDLFFLCRGTEGHTEAAKCFNKVMHGGIHWGGSNKNKWEITPPFPISKWPKMLCTKTRNSEKTIACFKQKTDKGKSWRNSAVDCMAEKYF